VCLDGNRTSKVKWHKVVVGFLGLKKNMLVLLTMVILVGLGEKMAERFLPLYLVALGGGAFLWNASASAKLFNLIGIGHGTLSWIKSIASPHTNFLTAFGFGILGTLYFAIFGKDLKGSKIKK